MQHMSRKHRRTTARWQWEQALIDAYADFRWHQLLDPLDEQFQRWKAGELSHDELGAAIHRVHRQQQELFAFFTHRREHLLLLIQYDRDWFVLWAAAHPPPPDIPLVQPSWEVLATDE